jgi:RNA polymerase sigma factor (sigma-70 family)
VDFPETQWSQILALQGDAGGSSAIRVALLQRLLSAYWRPVYHYMRALDRRGPAEAEDLTQQLFASLLDRGDLDRLSAARGSFRAFLKTAARHLLVSQRRAEQVRPQPLPFADAEAAYRKAEPAGGGDPEAAFDRAWVSVVLDAAVARLRLELRADGHATRFAIFEAYCLEDDAEVSYEALAARHQVSLDEVRNGLRACRQRLRQLLRAQLRQYLGPDEDVEAELRFVIAGL